jgi:hypothetical protein
MSLRIKQFVSVALLLIAASAVGYWRSRRVHPGFDPSKVLTLKLLPKPGDFYSFPDNGSFGVLKVLAVDSNFVHVRVYKDHFPQEPRNLDPAKLSLGTIDDKDGFGIGHLPLKRQTFANWRPRFLQSGSVTEEELDGYRYWKESSDGSAF